MRYVLKVKVEGTEGRVQRVDFEGMNEFLGVSRSTYLYRKDENGNFQRMPEEWFSKGCRRDSFEQAVSCSLEYICSLDFVPGDVFVCEFEGKYYEWIYMVINRSDDEGGAMKSFHVKEIREI
jgi:hypothetical protein